MFLAETPDCISFSELEGMARRSERIPCRIGRQWQLVPTAEDCSVVAQTDNQEAILLIAGHQFATREEIELLIFATRQRPADGQPLAALLSASAPLDSILVLPWGAGKWLGARGALIRSAIGQARQPSIWLGDSGNRPAFWPPLRVLPKTARERVGNFAGSDPLPLPGELDRIGSYGFSLSAPVSLETPASDIQTALSQDRSALRHFGRPMGAGRFLRNQILLRSARRALDRGKKVE
jgi:hypothetical protein